MALSPSALITQDPKIREVLGFGGPDARLEEKLMTVVAGPDPVNTTFLNFMAVQDDTVKVGWGPGRPGDSLRSLSCLSLTVGHCCLLPCFLICASDPALGVSRG